MTTDLERRVWEHKTHVREGFSKLVYVAEFARSDDAIAWQKALKGETRATMIVLIEEQNPRWNDLAWNWLGGDAAPAALSALASLRAGILRPSRYNRREAERALATLRMTGGCRRNVLL